MIKIGAMIIAATALGAIPQLHKLASSGSSAGVSAATSGLTLTFTRFNLLATLTVKAPSLRSCADSVLRCLPSLVDALQQAETALILLAILLLVVSLPPNDGATPRRGTAALLLALLALGAAIAAIDARAPCSAPSLAAAEALSAAASAIVLLAFAPQLAETWRQRGRGSLAYSYYFLQASGCLLVAAFQAVGLGDPWPVWGPTCAAGVMQGTVFAVGLSLLAREGPGRARRRREQHEPRTRLL